MGELIRLDDHRGARRHRRQGRPPVTTLHFDLACPFTYLALERIEREYERGGPATTASPAK